MYYQNYEDYMRSVLGYANNEPNYTYDNNNYYPRMEQPQHNDLDQFYPEVYRIVNPVVENVCNKNRDKQVTEDLVRSMTDEVYASVEGNAKLQLNVETKQELKNGDVRNPNAKPEPRRKNFLLNDLIRILILKNLLRPRPPVRPPYPGPNPRPPFPGGPGPRTPIM